MYSGQESGVLCTYETAAGTIPTCCQYDSLSMIHSGDSC